MKQLVLFSLYIFFLASGILGGISYARYFQREECLKMAFDDSKTENLSDDEIEEILKTLNREDSSDLSSTIPGTGFSDSDTSSQGEGDNTKNAPQNFVGSRNGNKFYPADCRYAKLIKEENKIFFGSREEGEGLGREYVECK